MKKCSLFLLFAGVILLSAASNALPPSSGIRDIHLEPIMGAASRISGTAVVDNTAYIDANEILMLVTNHGNFGRDLADIFGNDYGTYFPFLDTSLIYDGSLNTSPLYAAGIWLGGVDSATGSIRMAISEYSCEYVPGPMQGGTFIPDNPEFRVYKLYADSLEGNPNQDYLNWPIAQGAPLDRYGHPLCQGEQTLWAVYNDADYAQHNNSSGETQPLGVEIQQTIWASDEPGDDTLFVPKKLEVTQLGSSSLEVIAKAVDINEITGDQYLVEVLHSADSGVYWQLKNVNTGEYLLTRQQDFNGERSAIIEGLQISVSLTGENAYGDWEYTSADPPNISPVALADDPFYEGGRWFTGGNHDGEIFFGGVFLEPAFWGLTTLTIADYKPVEIRFRPMLSYTDLNANGYYTIGEPYVVDDTTLTQKAFMYTSLMGDSYSGFKNIPFTAWDVSDPYNPRQLNVIVRDRDNNSQWDLHNEAEPPDPALPNDGDQRYNYIWILNTDYDPSGTYYGDGTGGSLDFFGAESGMGVYDAMWVLWLNDRYNGGMLAEEGTFQLTPGPIFTAIITDTFTFVSEPPPIYTTSAEGSSIYIKYLLRNKGNRTIKDMYFSLWADPDLGWPSDDYVGCDTLDDIFFCYNSTDVDFDYNLKPPSSGFKIISGPLVPSEGNSAYFNGRVVNDFRNLNMTSFCKYINGTDPDNYLETYNYMRGLMIDGSPYIYDGHQLKYWQSGDPVAGTGDLDIGPADRRMMASCGPFDFRPGDSQYVLVKFAVGQGDDYLSSVTRLKEILNEPFDFSVGVEDDVPTLLPRQYALSQNFPNPFNSQTVIEYSLPERCDVSVSIYNILGRKVKTLVDDRQPAGNYRVVWDGRNSEGGEVASGIYFYSIQSEKYRAARKMLLLK